MTTTIERIKRNPITGRIIVDVDEDMTNVLLMLSGNAVGWDDLTLEAQRAVKDFTRSTYIDLVSKVGRKYASGFGNFLIDLHTNPKYSA